MSPQACLDVLENIKMVPLLGFEPRMFRLVIDLKLKIYLLACGA
jgi:hypothetical protein